MLFPRSIFRYRLRSLFALVILVSLLVGVVTHAFKRDLSAKAKEQRAIAYLRDHGVWVKCGRVERRRFLSRLTEYFVPDLRMRAREADFHSLSYGAERLQACLARLVDCPYVESLEFESCDVSDDDLEVIRQLKHLKRLNLRGTDVSDQGIGAIVDLPLECLLLGYTGVGDEACRHIGEMSQLKELELAGETDAGLRSLAKLSNLEALRLEGNWFMTDKGLRCLAKCRRLEELSLSGSEFTGSHLHVLAENQCLKSLNMNRSQLNAEGLRSICQIESLETLRINVDGVSDADMVHLRRLENLKVLEAPKFLMGPGFEHIAQLRSLEELDLGRTDLWDVPMAQNVTKMPKLKRLILPYAMVSDSTIDQIRKAKPQLLW